MVDTSSPKGQVSTNSDQLHAPDAEFVGRYPRAERYLDWPMLVVLVMQERDRANK